MPFCKIRKDLTRSFHMKTITILIVLLSESLAVPDKAPSGSGISGGYGGSSFVASSQHGHGQGTVKAKELHFSEQQQQQQSGSGLPANTYQPPSIPVQSEWGNSNQIQGNPNQGKELSSFSSYAPSGGGYASGPVSGAVDTQYGPPAPPVSSSGTHGGNYPPLNPISPHQDGQTYTYYYQHYPASYKPQGQGQGHGHGHGQGQGHGHNIGSGLFSGSSSGSWEEGSGGLFDFGDAGGAGLAGLGGLGGLAGVAAIAKGLLALKPLLLIGLLILLALPILLLFLPIPLITFSNIPPADAGESSGAKVRGMMGTYLSQFSERILNADECLERIICKIPQFGFGAGQTQGQNQSQIQGQGTTFQFQNKAKFLWEKYGKKYFSKSPRIQRAVGAFFMTNDGSSGRSRNEKCNMRFKCSNNLF